MARKLFVVLAVVYVVTGSLIAQSRTDANVVYGMHSGLALLGDIHHPAKSNGYAVVVVNGSAFSAPFGFDAPSLKDSATGKVLAEALTSSGYLVFIVNHRAAPRFKYPAAVDDVQRAVRFLRANAARYGIDPERIGAMGGSSGGHLVAMLGTLDGKGDPIATDALLRLSAKVQAVVAVCGAFDLAIQFEESSLKGVPEALFVGAGIRYGADLHRSASPITYVTSEDAPFLLYHGNQDTTVPMSHSLAMKSALEKAGVPVTFVPIDKGGHGQPHCGLAADNRLADRLSDITRWLDKTLKR